MEWYSRRLLKPLGDLLDAITLRPAACRILGDLNARGQTLPAQRPLDGIREAAAGSTRLQQRPTQGDMVLRYGREHLGLGEQVLLVPPLGGAPGGADQLVEHLDGEIGQHRLALDDEGRQRREPALHGQAQQGARPQDASLAGEDGVAVDMHRAPPLVVDASAAQHLQPCSDAGEVLQVWTLPGLGDPAEQGAASSARSVSSASSRARCASSRPRARSRCDCRRAQARPASARRSTRAGAGTVIRRSFRPSITA